jgi:hypothetical protein
MANELRGLLVGPMPVSQFMDDFLPAPDDSSLVPPQLPKLFETMPKTTIEKELYEPFVREPC